MSKMNKVLLRSVTAVALSAAMALGMGGWVYAAPTSVKDGNEVKISDTTDNTHTGGSATTSSTLNSTNDSVMVTKNNPTTYTVRIPKEINLTEDTSTSGSHSFKYYIACDLEPDQTMTIAAENVTLKHKAGSKGTKTHTLTPTLGTTSIAAGTYQAITECSGSLAWTTPIRAGNWAGTLDITVTVSDAHDNGIPAS